MKKFIKTEGKKILEIRPKMFEGAIEIEVPDTMKDLDVLRLHHYANGKLVKTDEIINKANLSEEYFEIRQWLTQNDWKVNKVFLGEWAETDPRWVEYKEQRVIKRARLDAIKQALGV
jgi:hypothetical protein